MERSADSKVAIIGHHREDEDLCAAKEMYPKQLGYAAYKGDGFISNKEVSEHFGSCDRGVADVYKGQVTEEEIHGGAQRLTAGYGDNNEQISCHNNHIEQEKQHKTYLLHPWIL